MPDGYDYAGVSTTKFQKIRNVIPNEPVFEWYTASKAKLNYLAQLPTGWDGLNAAPVSFNNANFALNMLSQVCFDTTPAPVIVPGINGNCQVEWHTLSGDLELNVKSPYHVEVWWSMLNDGVINENETLLTNDFTEIISYLRQITEPAIANVAAA